MPNVPNNNLIYDNLASGFDRNDGTNGKGGTPTAAGQIVVNASNGASAIGTIPIEEADDSPTIDRAEQGTLAHHYKLAYSEAINRLVIYGRGALVQDTPGNLYRVLSSSAQHQKGGVGLLSIVTESLSFDAPPDEFSIKPVKLGLDILKHPRYFFALMPTNQIPNFVGTNDTNAQIAAKQAIIRSIQAYRDNPVIPTSANINNMTGLLHDTIAANLVSGKFTVTANNPNFVSAIPATASDPVGTLYTGVPYPPVATLAGQPNPATYTVAFNSTSSDPNGKVALAIAAAQEIIGKLWRMEDSPMVNGVEITHSEYWFRPPPLNLGCYIENPTAANPPLPDYFYSTAYPPNASQTIFDQLSYINPQCFSSTGIAGGGTLISWLRDADDIDFQRTWFKVTRRWLGAPIGSWDADLYNQRNRPAVPTDYRNLILS